MMRRLRCEVITQEFAALAATVRAAGEARVWRLQARPRYYFNNNLCNAGNGYSHEMLE